MLSLEHHGSPWARNLRRRGLVAGILIGIVGMYLGFVFSALARRREHDVFVLNTTTVWRPLPDFGFDLVPWWGISQLLEVWMVVAALLTVGRFVLTEIRVTIFRRWLQLAGVLSFFHGFVHFMTVRPDPPSEPEMGNSPPACPLNASSVFLKALLAMAGQQCGLTAPRIVHLTLCLMIWLFYLDVVDRPVFSTEENGRFHSDVRWKTLIVLYYSIGICLAISSREEYSAEVFLWTGFTILTFKCYHDWILLLKLEALGFLGDNRDFIEIGFVGKIVLWLEAGAEDLDIEEDVGILNEGSNHATLKPSSQCQSSDESFEDEGAHLRMNLGDDEDEDAQIILEPERSETLRGYESFGTLPRS